MVRIRFKLLWGKNEKQKFHLVVVSILSASIIWTGCYSYRPITKEQLVSKSFGSNLKFVLNDNSEIIVIERDRLKISNQDTIAITKLDSTQQIITFNDIQIINEEKFDFGKTFFATFWILASLVAILVFIAGPKLSVG